MRSSRRMIAATTLSISILEHDGRSFPILYTFIFKSANLEDSEKDLLLEAQAAGSHAGRTDRSDGRFEFDARLLFGWWQILRPRSRFRTRGGTGGTGSRHHRYRRRIHP